MSVKGYFMLAGRADVTGEYFSRYWRDTHAKLADGLPGLHRYVQSHRLEPPGILRTLATRAHYQGLAELWADTTEGLMAMRHSEAYTQRLRPDEDNFIDRTRSDWLTTSEHVMIDRGGHRDGIKVMFLAHRRPDRSVEEFQRLWREEHAPLVEDTPGILRYVQSHVLPETYEHATPAWDGVAELWFRDLDALVTGLTSESFRIQGEDVRRFLDLDRLAAFVAHEHYVIDLPDKRSESTAEGVQGGV